MGGGLVSTGDSTKRVGSLVTVVRDIRRILAHGPIMLLRAPVEQGVIVTSPTDGRCVGTAGWLARDQQARVVALLEERSD